MTNHKRGRKPYGVRTGETEVVQIIQGLRDTGMTIASIVETLNNVGIKPRLGLKWRSSSVHKFLLRRLG
jgi:Recombinase